METIFNILGFYLTALITWYLFIKRKKNNRYSSTQRLVSDETTNSLFHRL